MKNFILKNLYSLIGEKQNQLRIITFHDILKEDESNFARLIEYLKEKWNIISPEEFKNFLKSENSSNSNKNILITFDDAYKSQKIVTEKYLDPINIKALFFIVSDFIKLISKNEADEFIKKNFFKSDNQDIIINSETYNMNLDDIKYLIGKGHTIGCHTKTHLQLSKIKDENLLKQEIINSKVYLEKALNNYKIEDFAYTFGDFESIDKTSTDIILKNFNYLYSGLRGNNINIKTNIIRRDAVDMKEDFHVISAYLNGYIDLIYKNKLTKLEKWTL